DASIFVTRRIFYAFRNTLIDTSFNLINQAHSQMILDEVAMIQRIRNKIVRQSYNATMRETEKAKNIAFLVLIEIIEPALNNMGLIVSSNTNGICVQEFNSISLLKP